MKFLVMEIQKFANGTMSTPTYSYDNINSAEAKYHAILSSAAVSSLPVHSCVMVNEEGMYVKSQCFIHDVEPEPEPTTE